MPFFAVKNPCSAIIRSLLICEGNKSREECSYFTYLTINTDYERSNGLTEWPLSGKQFVPIRGRKFRVENIVLTCPYWPSGLNEVASEKVNRVLPFFHGMVLFTIARRGPCEIFSLASSGSWWSNSAKRSSKLVKNQASRTFYSGINPIIFPENGLLKMMLISARCYEIDNQRSCNTQAAMSFMHFWCVITSLCWSTPN